MEPPEAFKTTTNDDYDYDQNSSINTTTTVSKTTSGGVDDGSDESLTIGINKLSLAADEGTGNDIYKNDDGTVDENEKPAGDDDENEHGEQGRQKSCG